MIPHELERRLQECWDGRRDPADDPQLTAWLLAHPHELERFAEARALLDALGGSGAGCPRRAALPRSRRRRGLAAVAGMAAAALLAGWVLTARAEAAPVGRVLAASLEIHEPLEYRAVTWVERQVLAATPDLRLEIIQQRSERR